MSDEFRRLVGEAERLALPVGWIVPSDTEASGSWHERMADSLHVTATGELRDARIVGTGMIMKVEFLKRPVPRSIAMLADNCVRGWGWDSNPERVAEAVCAARMTFVRACASEALAWIGHNAHLRLRGYHKQADHLAALAPEGLQADDWSDADSISAAPWRHTPWSDYSLAECLYGWTGRSSCDFGALATSEILDAIALSWICEAASRDSPLEVASSLAEAASACRLARFDAGWEAGLDSAIEEIPEDIAQRVRSEAARKAAHHLHRENHAMKAQVFAWCDENMSGYRSMDAAAEAIAGKLVPVTVRTARAWIGEWRKLQSARRP